jgi:hypothetical protein
MNRRKIEDVEWSFAAKVCGNRSSDVKINASNSIIRKAGTRNIDTVEAIVTTIIQQALEEVTSNKSSSSEDDRASTRHFNYAPEITTAF